MVVVGASPWVYPRETGLLSPNPKPPMLDDRRPRTRGARARLAAPGRGATRGGVERAERNERKEEGHTFPPG